MPENILLVTGCAVLLINLITFFVYAVDKYKVKNGYQRISEKTLMLWAIFGGATGALFAMKLFRHKTQHKKFTIVIPIITIAQIAIAIYAIVKWV